MLNTATTNWKENTIAECIDDWKKDTIEEKLEDWKKNTVEEMKPTWEKNFQEKYLSKFVHNLLAMGMNEEQIAVATGLSVEEIQLFVH